MSRFRSNLIGSPLIRTATAMLCAALMPFAGSMALADSYGSYDQLPPVAAQNSPPQTLAPDQLDNLVAPIALYPDPLLGQILAASTYPLEIVEAQQWLRQYGNLRGQALMEAARQQGWDPSVQVLVAFPDVLALLTRDVRWTTDLGNAFLAQQADVMNAIQALRFQARNSGRLATTPEQVVTTEAQNGQYAVRIEPANPQVIYPPVYDPAYVWGPPAWGAYPNVSYPVASYYPGAYGGYGFGFGSGINIAGLFSGLLNWGGWGWVLGWFTHSLSLASLFFNLLGFHGFGGGTFGGGGFGPVAGGAGALALWAHNPAHRLGVPYPRGFVSGGFVAGGFAGARNQGAVAGARAGSSWLVASTSTASASRVLASASGRANPVASSRAASDAWQRFGGAEPAYRSGASPNYRTASNAAPERAASNFQSNFSQRSATPRFSTSQASSPRYLAQASPAQQHFSTPRVSSVHASAPKFSAPKFSAPKSHFSAPKNSGGGHSGKNSHKH